MRFVDDNQVVGAPVERVQLEAVDVTRFARQVGVMQDIVAELVVRERVQRAGISVDGPVARKFLRAEDQNALVAQLEVLDDGQGGVGFTQADAVGQDATVVIQNLVDGGLGAILLEREERPPDVRVRKRNTSEVVIHVAFAIEVIAEKMKEREVVDELRGLIRVEFTKVEQDLLLDVLDQGLIVPDVAEPPL